MAIVVFDDGSSDGTPEAVAASFPDTLLLRGPGDAFWNRGLHDAWAAALALDVQGFLWLNDDVVLDPDAFSRLFAFWTTAQRDFGPRFILVGSTRDSTGDLSYGGLVVDRWPWSFMLLPVKPSDRLQPIDTFNGNIVLISRATVDAIGINDPVFFHNFGDVDYGLRATKAGIPVRLLPLTLGRCDANANKKTLGFGARSASLLSNWRKVNSHLGLPFRSWWRFTRRHSGAWGLVHFLLPYRHLVLPPSLLAWVQRRLLTPVFVAHARATSQRSGGGARDLAVAQQYILSLLAGEERHAGLVMDRPHRDCRNNAG